MKLNNVIERLFKKGTEYSDPSQATTTANALDLLSSGIYSEEERFVFELLQNAVDSYEGGEEGLSVRIVSTPTHLVFMHNGSAFSDRDIIGLCDIGNGNKAKDAKKIGYKGIGFKSVFMHSHRVTVLTGDTCFKFDKEYCKSLWKGKHDKEKLPWQIIPIETQPPIDIDHKGYNVVTYLETSNSKSLSKKVEKLLANSQFLLFLNVDDLNISYYNDGHEVSLLSKTESNGVLELSHNGVTQSKWLTYSKSIPLTNDIKEAISQDSKTPDKLKDSDAVELSFAVSLDDDGNISPMKDALVFTYLPTSFMLHLPFIINANFLTDAGRQQLIKDSEWNKFILDKMPDTYLSWMRDEVVDNNEGWYKIIPQEIDADDELSEVFNESLDEAFHSIKFVKTITNKKILLKKALYDKIGLHDALPKTNFNKFVKNVVAKECSYDTLVDENVGKALSAFKIPTIWEASLSNLLENSIDYLYMGENKTLLHFLDWLRRLSKDDNDLKQQISYSKIIPDEEGELTEPNIMFFPSDYRDENSLAESAKVINASLVELLDEEMREWLKEIGVQEMSNKSVIMTVLCKKGYITKENAIEVMRFIFESNKKESILSNLSSWELESFTKDLRLLSKTGDLKQPSDLYLADIYNPRCKIEGVYPFPDVIASSDYVDDPSEALEWAQFFRKLGVSDDLKLTRVVYDEDSWVMSCQDIDRQVDIAKKTEYNVGSWGTKFYIGRDIILSVNSSPLLRLDKRPEEDIMFDFNKKFWGRIFSGDVTEDEFDYIEGTTGFYSSFKARAYLTKPIYLGETFIEWLVKNEPLIPASDGKLYRIGDVLAPTTTNKALFGKYLPVLSIEGSMEGEWKHLLPMKKEVSLSEYLDVLDRISKDDKREEIAENKKRINKLYEYIADIFDEPSDYDTIREWGKTHRILSKEGMFEMPSRLCLLGRDVAMADVEGQVYHDKRLEYDRFAKMMTAMGVKFINDYKVDFTKGEEDNDTVKLLEDRIDFLTAISKDEKFTKSSWNSQKRKIVSRIEEISFYRAESIRVILGERSFEKTVYTDGIKFYYVGKFGIANRELLSKDLAKVLGISDTSTMLTLLGMNDFEEMKEYIEQKGYETSFIEIEIIQEPSGPVMGPEEGSLIELPTEEKRIYLEEAKDAILDRLSEAGYDTSKAEWDGWTCVDGVMKDGKEYPLVVRSNRSGRNTTITPKDWMQLMQDNAMFAVNTREGVGTVDFKKILKDKEYLLVKFASENIDNERHITELAHVFNYFKGIQFDFGTFVEPVIGEWQRFLAPEKQTGEKPIAASPQALPTTNRHG